MIKQTVFDASVWRAGHYRIPSLIVTKRGTLVACADGRLCGGGDNPNRIDKIVRRSTDGGLTWQKTIVAVAEHGEQKDKASAAIDPCMVYDPNADAIFMIYCHTPAGVGILSCKKGVGESVDGDRWVVDDGGLCLLTDGRLWRDGVDLGVTVGDGGDVFDADGNYVSNLYIGDGRYREYATSYLYMIESRDDGVTWSEPLCLNRFVKEPYMSFIGAGPGCGICVSKGAHRGRLLLPIYYNTAAGNILMLSCALIYSDDHGKTWRRGGAPVRCRKRLGIPFNERFLVYNDCTTESQVVECKDGSLRIFMRNHSAKKRIAIADSDDGGVTWRDFRFVEGLPQCICQCSAINVDDDGRRAIAVLNAADEKVRRNGVLRLSYDDGETYDYSILIKPDGFVYSAMAQTADGKIGVLYETSTEHTAIDFALISIDEIKEGKQWQTCRED